MARVPRHPVLGRSCELVLQHAANLFDGARHRDSSGAACIPCRLGCGPEAMCNPNPHLASFGGDDESVRIANLVPKTDDAEILGCQQVRHDLEVGIGQKVMQVLEAG